MLSVFAVSVLASLPQPAAYQSLTPSGSRTDRATVALQLRMRSTTRVGAVTSSSTAFASPRLPYSTGQGRRIAYMVGADNAECVRSTPDVNGDGRDEILVGIGKSGVDNVFCLDGASSGAASIVWQFQTLGGVSNGMVYGDQSIVPASDADGDGAPDVLIGTSWGGRTAYSFDTLGGSERWRFDTYVNGPSGWVYSLCEVSDVTGDGVPECAFGIGSDGDAAILVDGASSGPASVIWRYSAGDVVYSVRNLGDANGDGSDDVVAAVGDNVDRIVCLEGDSSSPGGTVLWTYVPGVSVYACGVLSDITGDGVNEALAVLWTLNGSAVRCLNGVTGALLWSSTAVPENGMAVDELADVTGDGVGEVLVASWSNRVIVLDGADGSLVWSRTVGTLNGGDVWTARSIDDLSSDGFQDVVAGSFDGNVYALDGADGEIFWAYDTKNRVFSVHPVGDLDGDGKPEVVAGTQDTTNSVVVHVLDGNAGIP